jgi:hypothetical protein
MGVLVIILALIFGPLVWYGWRHMRSRAEIIAVYRRCLEKGVTPPPALEAAFQEELQRNPGAARAVQPRLQAHQR